MPGSIYIKSESNAPEGLQLFAETMFRTLKISAFSRRQSDNYFGGEYFVGETLGVELIICLADDDRYSEYQFWLMFSAERVWIEDKMIFENLADLVARHLTLNNYQVARDPSSGRIGGPKLIYTRKTGEATSGRDQVEVKQIS